MAQIASKAQKVIHKVERDASKSAITDATRSAGDGVRKYSFFIITYKTMLKTKRAGKRNFIDISFQIIQRYSNTFLRQSQEFVSKISVFLRKNDKKAQFLKKGLTKVTEYCMITSVVGHLDRILTQKEDMSCSKNSKTSW